MKQIMCFGDSNTRGCSLYTGRFDYDTRWTGRLNEALGREALVCEAGLNGRTICFQDPDVPGRNGMEFVKGFMETHKPLDLMTVMLGTNDARLCYGGKSAAEITANLERMLVEIQAHTRLEGIPTRYLLIAPVPVDIRAMEYYDYDEASVRVTEELGECYKNLAEKLEIDFLDAGTWGIKLDDDGSHFSALGHAAFAERILPEIRAALSAQN